MTGRPRRCSRAHHGQQERDPQRSREADGDQRCARSPAMTTRGFKEAEARHVGHLIANLLDARQRG
jgi:hypothetical protein